MVYVCFFKRANFCVTMPERKVNSSDFSRCALTKKLAAPTAIAGSNTHECACATLMNGQQQTPITTDAAEAFAVEMPILRQPIRPNFFRSARVNKMRLQTAAHVLAKANPLHCIGFINIRLLAVLNANAAAAHFTGVFVSFSE